MEYSVGENQHLGYFEAKKLELVKLFPRKRRRNKHFLKWSVSEREQNMMKKRRIVQIFYYLKPHSENNKCGVEIQ